MSGLAVALVVICHVWFGRASAGIDVLLVLSGFFIGGRVLQCVGTSNRRSLGAELMWVARRILPALVLVLAVSAALTVLVQPQTRWEAFADQTLASLGFYQNWLLAGTASDYVQASETVTPLQHLWVLSVLGQFVVFLLVLAAAVTLLTRRSDPSRRRSILIGTAGLALVASLSYAIMAQSNDPTTAYYSSLTRAWELLAGVLAAAVVTGIRWPGWLRTIIAVAGLTAVVTCSLLAGAWTTSPGTWALLPVGATLLIIVSGAPGGAASWVNDVLDRAPLAALGAIAYPLYLWHWPLLIFWLAYLNSDAVGLVDGGAVIAASIVAAFVTQRCVEGPLRRPLRWRPGRLLTGTIIALAAVALAAMSVTWQGYVGQARASGAELSTLSARDYPGARAAIENRKASRLPVRPTVLEAPDDVPPSTVDGCATDFPDVEVIRCVYGDQKASRTIALAGGSHSEHWLTALHTLGRLHGFKVTTYLKMGCPLTTKEVPIIAGAFTEYPQCRTWSDSALAQIIADRPDYVFFTTTRPILNGPGDYVPDYYLGIWDELSANGIPMLGIRDTPWMVREGTMFAPVDCLADAGDPDTCGLPRYDALAERNPTLDHLADYPMMRVLDLSDAVCGPTICRAVEGNVLVYHDAHHLSATYVRTLTDELARQMSDATAWW
ncbi:MAG TPA: acyltransferase family protein [Mycobacterium sp.]|nr:acyltransferase family protein [Mycobacterium sp.]